MTMYSMRQGIDRLREQAAVVPVTAPHRRASLSGGRALLIGACYLSVGACGAWAIRSAVEARPVEFFGAWLAVSVVLASLWALRPRQGDWSDGDLHKLALGTGSPPPLG